MSGLSTEPLLVDLIKLLMRFNKVGKYWLVQIMLEHRRLAKFGSKAVETTLKTFGNVVQNFGTMFVPWEHAS